jgi:GNAT superfamily N-acetyltransferase
MDTSRIKIRDGDERDIERILSLRRLVFGEFEKDKLLPDFWKWEFMDGPEGKAFIYLSEEGERLAGHFADIPRRFSLDGEVCLGTLSLDLMVHPDHRRKGIFVEMGRYAARRVKGERGLFMTAFPIRKETISGLLKIGWEVVGDLPVLVFPLRFRGIVNRYLRFSPLSYLIGGVARAGYSLVWGGRIKGRDQGIQLEEVTRLDDRFDPFWEKAKGLNPVTGVRDRAFLNWRYFRNPVRTYTFFRALEGGKMTGYLVLRKVALLDFNSSVVVDLLALNEASLRALVGKGIEHSLQQGMDLLGCMIPRRHRYFQILRDLGFLPSPKTFLFMVYRLARDKVPLAPEAWYVNWGDSDVI